MALLRKSTGLVQADADARALLDTGVTATELDHLDDLTATVTELNYASDLTSALQSQLALPDWSNRLVTGSGPDNEYNAHTSAMDVGPDITITPTVDTARIGLLWRMSPHINSLSGGPLPSGSYPRQARIDIRRGSTTLATLHNIRNYFPAMGTGLYYDSTHTDFWFDFPNTTSAVTYNLMFYGQQAQANYANHSYGHMASPIKGFAWQCSNAGTGFSAL